MSGTTLRESSPKQGDWSVGVDVGGTFTDLVLADGSGTVRAQCKILTSVDPAEAVVAGVQELLRVGRVPPDAVGRVVHGTTLVTNTLLERTGARTALVTTRGFRDSLAMGKEQRYDVYDLRLTFPTPLVPRRLRLEIDERVTADGQVLRRPSSAEVVRTAARLHEEDVQAVAVCLIHSYLYPAHEQLVAEGLRRRLPGVPVVCSSDVNPEVREFERMSTTVISAYVMPRVATYLVDMQARLEAAGVSAPLFVMQSSGLLLPAAEAIQQPASLLESGPAAGALAAAQWARTLEAPLALAFDMGGTTAKACLVRDGRPRLTGVFEAAREQRLVPGSGLPVRVASVDLVEIGSGGGSIARVDQDERLLVGPESAGAHPGPACYGRGGKQPTFTDAALLRGRLDPEWSLAGHLRADRALAARAVASVAAALGTGVDEAADGILQVATERMAGALRVHATERGVDAASCLLVAFGGAAPICVGEVARRLGAHRIAVPPAAGVFSALGLVGAPVATETARSLPLLLSAVPWDELDRVWDDLRARAAARLQAGAAPLTTSCRVDARFLGQFHEIAVDVPPAFLAECDAGALEAVFRETYRGQFGHLPDVAEIQCLTWRLRAELVPARDVSVPFLAAAAVEDDGVRGAEGSPWRRLRAEVPAGRSLAGPGLVYDGFTTVSVDAGSAVTRLSDGTLLVTLDGDGAEEAWDHV